MEQVRLFSPLPTAFPINLHDGGVLPYSMNTISCVRLTNFNMWRIVKPYVGGKTTTTKYGIDQMAVEVCKRG